VSNAMHISRRGPGWGVAFDALLYGASAIFAVCMLAFSPFLRYHTWAWFALPAYASGALAALVLAVFSARLSWRGLMATRVGLAFVVLIAAAAVPLAAEVRWRAEGTAHYAAPEVVVTEHAAAELLRGRNPYSAHFTSSELAGRRQRESIAEHFPYLPGMAVFGVPRAVLPKTAWTDARVFFALATALAAAAALNSWRAPAERRLRALQVLVVLPTGAAALVVGGNDTPVLALSLLALVHFQRRHHAASAVAVAAAALLKQTAWPLLFAVALAARDVTSRRLIAPTFALAPVVVVLGVLTAIAAGPADFANDALLFPLGLTSLPSPAASTTVGSVVVGSVAGSPPLATDRVAIISALLAVALLVGSVVFTALVRGRCRRPARSAEAAAAAGAVLVALVVLAPVGRSGYFVYPIELLVWAALFREQASNPADRAQA
jgi:hypothetical protein